MILSWYHLVYKYIFFALHTYDNHMQQIIAETTIMSIRVLHVVLSHMDACHCLKWASQETFYVLALLFLFIFIFLRFSV